MLGNIQFIGELYKKDMLKETVMKTCVDHLLNAEREMDGKNLKQLRFKSGEIDDMNLEVRRYRGTGKGDECFVCKAVHRSMLNPQMHQLCGIFTAGAVVYGLTIDFS